MLQPSLLFTINFYIGGGWEAAGLLERGGLIEMGREVNRNGDGGVLSRCFTVTVVFLCEYVGLRQCEAFSVF